ncbi:MAG: hypothetical protein EXX96DRAFT_475105 [Benjaminiella poitrasii]|nr:MAG: hypothetical protein EXX96DRAFT_475105 [Benjaminiella poitrasii]
MCLNKLNTNLIIFYSVKQIFVKRGLERISRSESAYSFRVVWNFMDIVADSLPSSEFLPGEARLQAITNELIRHIELCLLEVSGPFLNDNTQKITTDLVKAAYGLLAMLHTVAHVYVYADLNIFKKFKVVFIHAANEKVRLWTLSLVSDKLYVLSRITSSILPTDPSTAENESQKLLSDLKTSHKKNKLLVEKDPIQPVQQLDNFLVEVAEIKLASRVKHAEDLDVSSSPIRPDDAYMTSSPTILEESLEAE